MFKNCLCNSPSTSKMSNFTTDIQKFGKNGVQATVGHQATVFNDGTNKVDAGAFATKTFNPTGPLTVGGNLGYTHVPSGSNVSVGAQHTPRFGTDVSATGTANIWQGNNGASSLDAVGGYGRHYGGPGGTSKPNYYTGVRFSHKF